MARGPSRSGHQLAQKLGPGASLARRIDQGRERCDVPAKACAESCVPLQALELPGEPSRVPAPVVARIATAQKSDGSGDPGSDDRHRGPDRLGHHVGAPFPLRAQDQRTGTGEPAQDFRARTLAEPSITRVGSFFPCGAPGHRRAQGRTDVQDPQAGARRQKPAGQGRAERVLHISKVRDDHDREIGRPARRSRTKRRGRRRDQGGCRRDGSTDGLIDDTALAALLFRKGLERQRLERDDPIGELEGATGPRGDRGTRIDVRARKRHDERRRRMTAAKPGHRAVASIGVKGDQEIRASLGVPGFDAHAVSEGTQDPLPAKGRHAVSGARAAPRGSDEPYLERAHVRKPAKTSRRSGV